MRGKITMKTEWSNGLKLSAKTDINQFNSLYYQGLLDLLYKTSPVNNFDIRGINNITIAIRAYQGQHKYNYDTVIRIDSIEELNNISTNIVDSLRQWSQSPYNFVDRG